MPEIKVQKDLKEYVQDLKNSLEAFEKFNMNYMSTINERLKDTDNFNSDFMNAITQVIKNMKVSKSDIVTDEINAFLSNLEDQLDDWIEADKKGEDALKGLTKDE